LRSLWTLDNFEFNRVPFVQRFVSLAYDSCVVDKYIWPAIGPDEAVTFCVIEPLDRAFHHSTTPLRPFSPSGWGGFDLILVCAS
jgi:hypothetical protein